PTPRRQRCPHGWAPDSRPRVAGPRRRTWRASCDSGSSSSLRTLSRPSRCSGRCVAGTEGDDGSVHVRDPSRQQGGRVFTQQVPGDPRVHLLAEANGPLARSGERRHATALVARRAGATEHLLDSREAACQLPVESLAGGGSAGRLAGGSDVLQGLLEGRLPAVEEREAERTLVLAPAVDAGVGRARVVVCTAVRRARQAGDVGSVAVLIDAVAADFRLGDGFALAASEHPAVAAHERPRTALPDAQCAPPPAVAGPCLAVRARRAGGEAAHVTEG